MDAEREKKISETRIAGIGRFWRKLGELTPRKKKKLLEYMDGLLRENR